MTLYEIRVQEHLSAQRLRAFAGITVGHDSSGETTIIGSFPDQSALFGLLNWLHDLGAVLVSLRRLETPKNGKA
ncbi:MAG: hypothetical protein JXB30_04755 [Anaerolineae bacterium]|nr:hypothetical protein [Anaerolineae bacterium]